MLHRTRNLSMFLFIALAAILHLAYAPFASAAAQPADAIATLYVNNQHARASDSNPGTEDQPLKTIGGAAKRALANRAKGSGTSIRIASGTYREALTLTPGDGAPISFEAVTPGQVVVSGSDVWGGWRAEGNGMYTHDWPYDWGTEPNTWGAENIDVPPVVRRHELIFVNGRVLRQVMSPAELGAGMFVVDETLNRVTIKAPDGVDIAAAKVEVATRDRLLQIQRGSNITVRGLIFQHGNDVLDQATVWLIDMANVLVEDCVFQWNNAVGMKVTTSHDITIRRSTSRYNGIDGMGAYRVRNLLIEDTTTSFNNWRGMWGNVNGWSIGQKFMNVHGAVFRRYTSTNNMSRGFWLDTDNSDVIIEDSVITNNQRDGMFLEANGGPITIRNSTIAHNVKAGVLVANSANVTLSGNTMCANRTTQVGVTGTMLPRQIVNWETGVPSDIYTERMTMSQNVMLGAAGGQMLFTTSLSDDPWRRFTQSLTAGGNSWYHTAAKPFQIDGGKQVDLRGWQGSTGQDATSSFARPAEIAACQQINIFLPYAAAKR